MIYSYRMTFFEILIIFIFRNTEVNAYFFFITFEMIMNFLF